MRAISVYRLSFPIHGDTNSQSPQITRRRFRLRKAGQHGLTRRVKRLPLRFIMQRRNSHRFAAVEPHQGGIDQFIHLHDAGNGIHIFAAVLPNLGARRRRQYRLDVYAFRAQLNIEPL